MKPSYLTPFAALVACGLAGCVSTPKPADVRALAPAAATAEAAPPRPDDPLPPGLSPKFVALLQNQGLSPATTRMGEAARLTVAWNNKIIYAPDPTKGGEPMPGLLTRIYLFGPDQTVPVKGNGELLVALYDQTPKAAGGAPKLMELWHIDPEAAKKFQRPDFMGDGYTLFLPFSNYHVDLKQVNVVVRYNGADGRNLVASPETLTLDHSETLQRAAEKLGAKRDPLLDVPLLQQMTDAKPQAAIVK